MPDIDEAIEALLAYQQADMEGTMVLTSRQAIHEVADELKRLRAVAARASEPVDPAMTPKEFMDSILSACDASNWDADRNKGDYYRGLHDAYEAVQEIAIEYQTAMYEWTRSRLDAQPSSDSALREAAKKVLDANFDFRNGLPEDWEGDPLQDACNELMAALALPSTPSADPISRPHLCTPEK